jgi:hypothetical protein
VVCAYSTSYIHSFMILVPQKSLFLNKGFLHWSGLFHVDHHNYSSYLHNRILWGLHLPYRVGFWKPPLVIGFLYFFLELIGVLSLIGSL